MLSCDHESSIDWLVWKSVTNYQILIVIHYEMYAIDIDDYINNFTIISIIIFQKDDVILMAYCM